MKKKIVVSPISIDLGSKTTGVYLADYREDSTPDQIKREGVVYEIEKNAFTLMMKDRTAKRHQRRATSRRQMVKRLFRLIWCEELGLEWDENTQQSISFLLNRRGFSFLTEEYSAELLKKFPKNVMELLPESTQNKFNSLAEKNGDCYRLDNVLSKWTNESPNIISDCFEEIIKEPKRIKRRLKAIGDANKLENLCVNYLTNRESAQTRKLKKELSSVSQWIVNEWKSDGIKGLNGIEVDGRNINISSYLEDSTIDARAIVESIPKDYESETRQLKKDVWNFRVEKFQLDKAVLSDIDKGYTAEKFGRSHLHHLAFSLYTINQEFKSGARHRSKYFEEVKNVLSSNSHTHKYLLTFCTKLQNGEFKSHNEIQINPNSLAKLICHLSNLELKPLRKYFNDTRHANKDYWNKDRLTKMFNRWILREWRVDIRKDKDKDKNSRGDYEELREKWTKRKGDVISFWLQTDPFFTIPPYQDANNRRPPKCQSLILNPRYLDEKYCNWRTWLNELRSISSVAQYLEDYEDELKALRSGKGNQYFQIDITGSLRVDSGIRTGKDLDSRVLQFIFDRVKRDDPLRLNEIYSHTKKLRQRQSTNSEKQSIRVELESSVKESTLPSSLKSKRNYQHSAIFKDGSFLHLVCNYYKFRQNARDGRIFIFPEFRKVRHRGYENTGRFDDRHHLLSYCNHKPRQKRYQMTGDLAGLFGVTPNELTDRIKSENDEEIVSWLKTQIRGLTATCDKVAKLQKEHRGDLKNKISAAYIFSNGKATRTNRDLYEISQRAIEICNELGALIQPENKLNSWISRFEIQPANAVFLLAQLNNIAFESRDGNSKTCTVCSFDNARRMQISDEHLSTHSKAQRLPAISTRLIDGAVMRLARIVGLAIATEKWKTISNHLERGCKVRIPIITELNRFQFEPDLTELKNRRRIDGSNYDSQDIYSQKIERVKDSVGGLSPYSGQQLGEDGEIDHIIPRSSQWGTLNDEANLIFASKFDNQGKGEKEYFLHDLDQRYKLQQFGTVDDSIITEWIESQIYDSDNECLNFGRYFNYVNLPSDQQKAFRHALFLRNHKLRNLVIEAIDHKTKTLVNGTQRYFAEVLARGILIKAKEIGKEDLISFDYFNVEANENSRGDGVYRLRKELTENFRKDLSEFDKDGSTKQKPYSHLLDAQVAFCMVADAHQKEGGLRLNLEDNGLWTRSGSSDFFDNIQVEPGEMRVTLPTRLKASQKYYSNFQIHRDGIYAERYLPILVHKQTSEVRIGFDWTNSAELNDNKANRQGLYFAIQFNSLNKIVEIDHNEPFKNLAKLLLEIGFKSNSDYLHLSLNVRKIHEFYIDKFNTLIWNKPLPKDVKFLRKLAYRTERKNFSSLTEAQKILTIGSNFQVNFGGKKLILPVKREWESLVENWSESNSPSDSEFLNQYFNVSSSTKKHEKVRKVFSLPTITSEGKFLIRRNDWRGKSIYQIVNDSDSRIEAVKHFTPVFVKKTRELGPLLSDAFKSSNLFLLNEKNFYYDLNDEVDQIDNQKWYGIEVNEIDSLKKIKSLKEVAFKVIDMSRPKIQLQFSSPPTDKEIKKVCENTLLEERYHRTDVKKDGSNGKSRFENKLHEISNHNNEIEYTGKGFTTEINEILSVLLENDNN